MPVHPYLGGGQRSIGGGIEVTVAEHLGDRTVEVGPGGEHYPGRAVAIGIERAAQLGPQDIDAARASVRSTLYANDCSNSAN